MNTRVLGCLPKSLEDLIVSYSNFHSCKSSATLQQTIVLPNSWLIEMKDTNHIYLINKRQDKLFICNLEGKIETVSLPNKSLTHVLISDCWMKYDWKESNNSFIIEILDIVCESKMLYEVSSPFSPRKRLPRYIVLKKELVFFPDELILYNYTSQRIISVEGLPKNVYVTKALLAHNRLYICHAKRSNYMLKHNSCSVFDFNLQDFELKFSHVIRKLSTNPLDFVASRLGDLFLLFENESYNSNSVAGHVDMFSNDGTHLQKFLVNKKSSHLEVGPHGELLVFDCTMWNVDRPELHSTMMVFK